MKWLNVGDKHVSGPYQVYRTTMYFELYISDSEGFRAINRYCESLQSAKALATHDWELKLKAEAQT